MKANEKERKCIDYSKKIIKKAAYSKLKEDNQDILNTISLKSLVKSFSGEYDNKKYIFIKDTLLGIILTVVHIVFSALTIIVGLCDMLILLIKLRRILIRLNYNTSEIKTFNQLWNDKGINPYGVIINMSFFFSEEDELECMLSWFKILYEKDEQEFNKFKNIAFKEIQDTLKKTRNHPIYTHVTVAKVHNIIPDVIDDIYPNYLKI